MVMMRSSCGMLADITLSKVVLPLPRKPVISSKRQCGGVFDDDLRNRYCALLRKYDAVPTRGHVAVLAERGRAVVGPKMPARQPVSDPVHGPIRTEPARLFEPVDQDRFRAIGVRPRPTLLG